MIEYTKLFYRAKNMDNNKDLNEKLKHIKEFEFYQDFVQRTIQDIEQELYSQGFQTAEIQQSMDDSGILQWQHNISIDLQKNYSQIEVKQPQDTQAKNSIARQLMLLFKGYFQNLLTLNPLKKIFLSLMAIGFIFWIIVEYFALVSVFYLTLLKLLLGAFFFFALALFVKEGLLIRFILYLFTIVPLLFVPLYVQDIITGEQRGKVTNFQIDECHFKYRKDNEKYLCFYANEPSINEMIKDDIGKVKILRNQANNIDYLDMAYYPRTKTITQLKIVKKKKNHG